MDSDILQQRPFYHAHTEHVFHFHGPCQVVVLEISSDPLPCTIIIINALQEVRKTDSGAEVGDTEHLAGPARVVSRSILQDWQPLIQ